MPLKFKKLRKKNVQLHVGGYARRRTGEDPAVLDVSYRICGDRGKAIKMAKTFLSLKQTFPSMTLPEGLFYIYLQANQINFSFQSDAAGGRSQAGGSVVDFFLPTYANAIRVNGDYWHSGPGKEEHDEAQKLEILGSYIDGVKVLRVTDIWESRILDCGRDAACFAAVQGIELGRL